MSRNILSRETSPYLLQHKDNPVHWRPWRRETLDEAKRQGKPILLSVGYAACHWCHVMAHESFEDDAVAALMNELFVNIKVDREERPDVDTIYQSALALMGQQGGWPLTMFLTPDGEPFWGGTYFPPTARYGRPGFVDVLRGVAGAYRNQPDTVRENVLALREGLSNLSRPRSGEGLDTSVLDQTAGVMLRMVDALHGGTVGAPKFPQPILFRFLWRTHKRTKVALFSNPVTATLDAMAQGGIYDHLGGGFARYSTDERWLVPHFEKMLYDNALLIDLLAEVWQDTLSPLYEARIRETVEWVTREMRVPHPEGGAFAFASALDADSEGVEGRYYVWTEAEIDALLGDQAGAFKRAYGVTAAGNWEGSNILTRSAAPRLGTDDHERFLAHCRATLLAARARRVPPGRDDKVLADWNGLMIAALAKASAVFDIPAWLAAARAAFTFVTTHMQQRDGRLFHVWCAGEAAHGAVIDDYANMARAALALHEVTGETAYLDQAIAWIGTADRHFWDADGAGYFLNADATDDVITRPKTIMDNATPSGNGVMLEVLARLCHLTGDTHYRQRADALVRLFSGDAPQYLISIPGFLTSFELLAQAVQIAIIGDPMDPATRALHRQSLGTGVPLRVISLVPPDQSMPLTHPAHGKSTVDGRPAAYVCVGSTCGLPITDPAELKAVLATL
ncbi:MAG: thioredoxin domain-containing protein [Rhodospirillales bacterium]